jgi:hypothetical protein
MVHEAQSRVEPAENAVASQMDRLARTFARG